MKDRLLVIFRMGDVIIAILLMVCLLIFNTTMWIHGVLSDRIYLMTLGLSLWYPPVAIIEQSRPELAQSIKACVIGSIPGILMATVPKYFFPL